MIVELLEAIKLRRSVRKFTDAQVSDTQIKELLESAMFAPSACNMRPWYFVVIKNREKLNKITQIAPYTQMLKTANCAILVCATTDLNNEISMGMYPQDCSAATQNILLRAVDLGLGSCWCGLHPNEKYYPAIRDLLELSDNIEPFALIAIGVPAENGNSRGFYDDSKIKWM